MLLTQTPVRITRYLTATSSDEDVTNVEIAHIQCYPASLLSVLPEQITKHHISTSNLKATVGCFGLCVCVCVCMCVECVRACMSVHIWPCCTMFYKFDLTPAREALHW